MGEKMSSVTSTSSTASNDPLLNLFTAFLDNDMKDCLLLPGETFEEILYDGDDVWEINLCEYKNKLKLASFVLSKSLDNIHYRDADGTTFLHHFFEICDNEFLQGEDREPVGLEIVKNLLDRGASLTIHDNRGYSPFLNLLQHWHEDYVELVLKKLKKICICEVHRCEQIRSINASPVHVDEIDHLLLMLQICAANGVDVSMHTDDNSTPIIKMCDLSVDDENNISACGKIKIVDALIDQGYSVNAADNSGYTALHNALLCQETELVERLIELGADVNRPTKRQHTPLFLALKSFIFTEILGKVDALLKAGAEVNAETINDDGDKAVPPLICAMMINSTEVIQCLIEHGADVNCREATAGFMPIHFAALQYNPVEVDLLLENGCNVNGRTASGLTALHLVMGRIDTDGDIAIFKRLIENRLEDSRRRSAVIASLIRAGAEVNARDSLGMTPLHYATLATPVPISRQFYNPPKTKEDDPLLILLSLGTQVHVNQPADDGQLPMHNALKNCTVRVILDLLRFGADLGDIEPVYLNKPWKPRLPVEPHEIDEICRYISKLIMAGMPAIKIPDVDDYPAHNIPYEKYSGEIENLKNYYIEGRVSLYAWLHLNYTKAQPFYLRGVPPEFESMFPHYYEIILARYCMVKERIPLLEPAKSAWYQFTEIDLPEECVERILFHINNRYLRFLAEAFINQSM